MKYLSLAIVALVFLVGCSQGQKIYDNPNAVSIYLYEEPKVTEDSYSIKFTFEHHRDEATHAIQKLEWNWRGGAGIESFKTWNGKLIPGQRDHHYREKLTYEKRTMTIMAGKVIEADETELGFAMLPSDWPERFNPKYLSDHVIRGQIIDMYPETATKYTLEFNRGTLIFEVEGGKVRYVWTVVAPNGSASK